MHALRRNVDLNLLLINNAIYGLTKGQYSPTSSLGKRSPSTPEGSIDTPVNPAALALGAGGGFVARTADTLQQHLPEVLIRAHQYKGASLVEVLQNCIVYNADVFGDLTNKKTRAENTVLIEHGQPLLFGADQDKALKYDAPSGTFSVTDDLSAAALHDETNLSFASALARIDDPALPTPLGVLYCKPRPDYTSMLAERVPYQSMSRDDLKQALYAGSWEA